MQFGLISWLLHAFDSLVALWPTLQITCLLADGRTLLKTMTCSERQACELDKLRT